MRIEIQETTEAMIAEQMDGTPEENAAVDVTATAIALDEAQLNAVKTAFPDANVQLASDITRAFWIDTDGDVLTDVEYANAERYISQALADVWDAAAFWRFNND